MAATVGGWWRGAWGEALELWEGGWSRTPVSGPGSLVLRLASVWALGHLKLALALGGGTARSIARSRRLRHFCQSAQLHRLRLPRFPSLHSPFSSPDATPDTSPDHSPAKSRGSHTVQDTEKSKSGPPLSYPDEVEDLTTYDCAPEPDCHPDASGESTGTTVEEPKETLKALELKSILAALEPVERTETLETLETQETTAVPEETQDIHERKEGMEIVETKKSLEDDAESQPVESAASLESQASSDLSDWSQETELCSERSAHEGVTEAGNDEEGEPVSDLLNDAFCTSPRPSDQAQLPPRFEDEEDAQLDKDGHADVSEEAMGKAETAAEGGEAASEVNMEGANQAAGEVESVASFNSFHFWRSDYSLDCLVKEPVAEEQPAAVSTRPFFSRREEAKLVCVDLRPASLWAHWLPSATASASSLGPGSGTEQRLPVPSASAPLFPSLRLSLPRLSLPSPSLPRLSLPRSSGSTYIDLNDYYTLHPDSTGHDAHGSPLSESSDA